MPVQLRGRVVRVVPAAKFGAMKRDQARREHIARAEAVWAPAIALTEDTFSARTPPRSLDALIADRAYAALTQALEAHSGWSTVPLRVAALTRGIAC
jgi:hypothetical protein